MFIVNFISRNDTEEAKIKDIEGGKMVGLIYWIYDINMKVWGGLYSDVTKSEATLNNLFYLGDKKPHIWGEIFFKQHTADVFIHQI